MIVPLKLEWEPVYALPGLQTGGQGGVSVGDRLKVVFAGREYVAVVSAVDVNPTASLEKIKTVAGTLDLPRVSQEEIRLWRQVASYYMCTVGEVYRMAYPVQKMARSESERAEAANARLAERVETRRRTLEARVGRLDGRIALRRGKMASCRKDSVRERLGNEIAALLSERDAVTAQIAALYAGLSPDGTSTVPSAASSGAFHEYGSPAGKHFVPQDSGIELSPAQTAAHEAVHSAFAEHKPVLLQGVTGSGKTEIYMKLADEALARGQNVLYLVPEIALSRQLARRLELHFGETLCCYHSALGISGKKAVLQQIGEGRPYVMLGTRSSIFLPHRDLGLIVVDEEHDGSYKQDSPAPRYNGRDVALMLSSIHRCSIILGSATPSFESLYNCGSGRFRKVGLGERFHGEGETEVELIDTDAERKKRGMVGSISRRLIALLKDTFEEGGQAMVLRARKSYATTLQCSECGAIIRCPHCNVSLSLQKSRGKLVCNHCGFTMPYSEHIPHRRPSAALPGVTQGAPPEAGAELEGSSAVQNLCNGKIVAFGTGTEKVEEELAAIFPERRIARLDADTSARAGWQKSVLRDFEDRKIDILVGTQMLTKGFDFDNLSLVAVLQADSLLGQQDFRADEKAVQLLAQFRGRCSRRGQKGVFAIQTSQPEHPVYQMILSEGAASSGAGLPGQQESGVLSASGAADYTAALMDERRTFGYPPYTRIVNVIMKDASLERLERLSSLLSLVLRGSGTFPGQGVCVTPAFAPAVDKVSDEYIRVVRVSFPKDRNLAANKDALSRVLRDFSAERKYDSHISVDVDPS